MTPFKSICDRTLRDPRFVGPGFCHKCLASFSFDDRGLRGWEQGGGRSDGPMHRGSVADLASSGGGGDVAELRLYRNVDLSVETLLCYVSPRPISHALAYFQETYTA